MIDLSSACVAHYKMNDNANNKVVINPQGFFNGIAQQNTSDLHTVGKVGGALSFNGVDDYIDCNATFELVIQKSFSVNFWVKFTITETECSFLGAVSQVGGYECGLLCSWCVQGPPYLNQFIFNYQVREFNSLIVYAPFALQSDTWYMITMIVTKLSDTSAMLLAYVNGTLVGSQSNEDIVMSDFQSDKNFYVGCLNSYGEVVSFFNGTIDNVMIFNKALNEEEIAFLWNNGSGTEELTEIVGATLETALVFLMKNNADISEIVDTNIFPNLVPQSASIPAITYQLIDSVYDYTLESAINLVHCRYQLNCWAETYKEARQLGNAIKALFDGYSGIVSGMPIRQITIADEADIIEPPELEALKRFGKRIDLMIWYHEQT